MSKERIRIRPAVAEDVAAIMPVFAQARAAIAALGIDQWQDGYPTEAHIEADIAQGYCGKHKRKQKRKNSSPSSVVRKTLHGVPPVTNGYNF